MQSILERRLSNDPEFEDIKACQRQARISGISSVIIGSGATFVTLKFTKVLDRQPKYIPLVCLGVGVCCGYIKSVSVIQKYRKKQRLLHEKQTDQSTSDSVAQSVNETPQQSGRSVSRSKYGDDNFFMDEKGSK